MDAFEDPLLGRFQSQASLRLRFKYHGDSIVAILQLQIARTLFQLFHSFSLQCSVSFILPFSPVLPAMSFPGQDSRSPSWRRVYSRRSHWV